MPVVNAGSNLTLYIYDNFLYRILRLLKKVDANIPELKNGGIDEPNLQSRVHEGIS
jgi:hypothetical protein